MQVFLNPKSMKGVLSSRKRSRPTENIFRRTDFPKLVQWEILRWVIRFTQQPELLKHLCLISKVWHLALTDWSFWYPIFEDVRIQRQKLVPPGIQYLIRPPSLVHLNPIQLYTTKLPAHGKWFSGFATVIRGASLYEGSVWGNLPHGSGVLYEHAGQKSPALRYHGGFKQNHLHCTTGDCEYLMGDGTVFKGNIEYRDRNYHCQGLFKYSDQHAQFPGMLIDN